MWRIVVLLLALAQGAQAACRADSVLVQGDWGKARFSVEIADDPRSVPRD